MAISITTATFSCGVLACGMIVIFLLFALFSLANLANSLVIAGTVTLVPSMEKLPHLSIFTDIGRSGTAGGFWVLPGNFKFNELGTTKEEVNIKKINNRKIISVNDDILNSADTLLLFFKPITFSLPAWLK